MNNTRKAQAALEFLMTYGWAILVVLIAIGALAFFGVLSPERFLPSKCTLQPGLACVDHKITTDEIQVIVKNGYGSDITINGVTVQGCGTTAAAYGLLANGAQTPTPITIPCTPVLSGSKFNGIMTVNYTNEDSQLTKSNIGDVVGTIE